jgi:hypothetical protein
MRWRRQMAIVLINVWINVGAQPILDEKAINRF